MRDRTFSDSQGTAAVAQHTDRRAASARSREPPLRRCEPGGICFSLEPAQRTHTTWRPRGCPRRWRGRARPAATPPHTPLRRDREASPGGALPQSAGKHHRRPTVVSKGGLCPDIASTAGSRSPTGIVEGAAEGGMGETFRTSGIPEGGDGAGNGGSSLASGRGQVVGRPPRYPGRRGQRGLARRRANGRVLSRGPRRPLSEPTHGWRPPRGPAR